MTDQRDSEIDQLWAKYSKDDLWKQVSEWWESASRARVVMLLAMNHKQSLSLSEIIEKAGASEANVLKVLKELQDEGIVVCHGQPAAYFDCTRLVSIPQGVLCHDVSGVT